jgi:putative Holliday junction resolvase
MGRILALDVGSKRIGIAVSDEMELAAHGVGVIKRENGNRDIEKIKETIEEYSAGLVVVGMPLNMDGTFGKSAEKISCFVNYLRNGLKVPVEVWDERLTTVSSEKVLIEAGMSRQKRKKTVDMVAATILLQCFLDCRREES